MGELATNSLQKPTSSDVKPDREELDKMMADKCSDGPDVSVSAAQGNQSHAAPCSASSLGSFDVIDMGYGDIELRVNRTIFKTHMHVLSSFSYFQEMIQRLGIHEHPIASNRSINLERDESGAKDMNNAFKIIYASVITGPFEFAVDVLVSALRIATAYDYPKLRTFTIGRLERAGLGSVKKIELAREFGLASWEGPAYDELFKRDEALTEEEARILGVTAFAKVARAREERKLGKGKELGEREYIEKLRKVEEARRMRMEQEAKVAQERARREAEEERARRMAEERAKRELEERASREEELIARKAMEEKAIKDAERRARSEAQERSSRRSRSGY